ncbi:MAG TPA: M14 family metallopeptidase [Solirubrobacteraceae bacterium]|nr:M14 family metallopeptidase [Solirubrobacteraceae bacterium]
MNGRRRWVAGALVCAFGMTGSAVAQAQDEERGIDPNQGERLVEVGLPSKAAAIRLQLEAENYGVEFNDHYLRTNDDGSVTVSVFGSKSELDALEAAGYEIGVTVESPRIWADRVEAREIAVRKEEKAEAAAVGKPGETLDPSNKLVVLRADYFENYAGRFLSVETKYKGATMNGNTYVGPTLSLTWNSGAGTAWFEPARTMSVNIDTDTSPDTYIEHRELVRIGDAGTTAPVRPARIRIGTNLGDVVEAPVETWLGGGLPPMGDTYDIDFTSRYMDPTEVYGRFSQLAAEYSNIAELVTLPNKTNGYQRRAQATMAGTTLPGNAPSGGAAQNAAVVLTSRDWGHEGGNDISAEFVKGAPGAPLSVAVVDKAITVTLATNASDQLTSTATQVANAINANAAASQLVVARTFRATAGSGIVLPRARVNLSDFLKNTITLPDGTTRVTNDHVPRGPFEYSAMRIGKQRDGSKVGVFLYCQQHAREWATPLTCLETAERLLVNYATDEATRRLVDNLDIFILPSSNPDGSHYSIHNFALQRRNMTNHCVVGGKETDDPFAANFWTPAVNPSTGLPVPGSTGSDPAVRNQWGVDLNRNNTFATLFDGFIGASTNCTSDVYAGPGEASEPEIRNELWIADTFDNIKFSNNIHSYGGYFMWAPGAYLPNRDEGAAVHANIGVEKYFFAAGDKILNRIKEIRNTAILPERTGPIADVLYSAAGNSADEHWYNRGVIAYSFETGADRFGNTSLTAPAAAGATGVRLASRGGFEPGDRITIGAGTNSAETRTVASVAVQNPTAPAPNVTLTEALSVAHAAGEAVAGGTTQVAVGFQPDYASEGKFEALEFASGNFGLLESAYDYAFDKHPPIVRMTNTDPAPGPINTTFEFVNEPSVIHYTTDGSTPTESSTEWDSSGPREPGRVLTFTKTTTVRWRAEDIKGNVSVGSQKFSVTGKSG